MDKKAKGLKIEGRDRNADLRTLTLKWIEALEWEDCEYGAWWNDPKRPFGNSGENQIARDILKIIGVDIEAGAPTCPHCNEVLDEDKAKRLFEYAHDLFADIPNGLRALVKP